MSSGFVYIVGAGPGDPGLITRRGWDCICRADCIMYDLLVNPRLLDAAPAGCEKLFVGKSYGNHAMEQEDICRLLAEKAANGKTVVRLKGGDPYVFGRGGEEAAYLSEKGIPFRLVPGVTSAIAGPAYAGIPVTHRDTARALHIVTARTGSGPQAEEFYRSLSALDGTLVVLMGLREAANIAELLVKNGKDPQTPCAVISQAATPRQVTVSAPLCEIGEALATQRLTSPALFVVGKTVELKDRLNFFEKLPLFGLRFLSVRPAGRQGAIESLLEENGAEITERPLLTIQRCSENLTPVLSELSQYNAVMFTSEIACDVFFDTLFASGLDARSLSNAKLYCVGKRTAFSLERRLLKPDFVTSGGAAELVSCIQNSLSRGSRILFPHSALADMKNTEILRLDYKVDSVPAYKVLPMPELPNDFSELLQELPNGMLFFSPSAADAFCAAADSIGLAQEIYLGIPAFSIGPSTAAALKRHGFSVIIESSGKEPGAFIQTVIKYFRGDML